MHINVRITFIFHSAAVIGNPGELGSQTIEIYISWVGQPKSANFGTPILRDCCNLFSFDVYLLACRRRVGVVKTALVPLCL